MLFAVCMRIPKLYSKIWKDKFSNFGSLASSNLRPFFIVKPLRIENAQIFSKINIFDELRTQSAFLCLKYIKNKKWQFLQAYLIFPIFQIFPRILILDHFYPQISHREIYLMPLNLSLILDLSLTTKIKAPPFLILEI